MLHAIFLILLIILVVVIINRLSPGLLYKLMNSSLKILLQVLKFSVIIGIVIGIGAYIYNIQEEKKQQESSAKYAKEQEERDFQIRLEADRQQKEIEQRQELERQATEKRQAEESAERARVILIDRNGPDSINDWEWHVAGTNSKNEEYYVSWNQTRRLYNDSNKKQFWWRTGNDLLSKIVVDCSIRSVRLELVTLYDSFGKRILKSASDYTDRPFIPIDTKTIMGDLANQICRKFN